jgi:hypothetical protein
LDGRRIFGGDCLETSILETRGECCQSSNGVTHADLSKITKVERIEEVVLIYVWLSGIKALPDTNS